MHRQWRRHSLSVSRSSLLSLRPWAATNLSFESQVVVVVASYSGSLLSCDVDASRCPCAEAERKACTLMVSPLDFSCYVIRFTNFESILLDRNLVCLNGLFIKQGSSGTRQCTGRCPSGDTQPCLVRRIFPAFVEAATDLLQSSLS